MKIVKGYQDTRTNNEDFLLTPAIGLVYSNSHDSVICGLAITFGWWSVFAALEFNLPKEYPLTLIKRFKK